jgi:hypothetical protein
MSEERKRSRAWPWIVTPLMGLPVLYVLSGAPAAAIVTKLDGPEWAVEPGRTFYAPLSWMLGHVPDQVAECYSRYGEWCGRLLGLEETP